jgi:hypothetical protein
MLGISRAGRYRAHAESAQGKAANISAEIAGLEEHLVVPEATILYADMDSIYASVTSSATIPESRWAQAVRPTDSTVRGLTRAVLQRLAERLPPLTEVALAATPWLNFGTPDELLA